MAKVLLYLHGFQSSSSSLKAQQTKSYISLNLPNIKFIAPQLPCLPKHKSGEIYHIPMQNKND
ncbi:MAG: hypothetical protein KAH18_00230 [Psychromonas sp.]|nr:hypothetical protein [Psychromonas sp.]